ncbi:flap endonuclease 1 [Candidatus Methanoperedens nitroreducens]|uniref:Flap endonuclease 1 n=1 Tax=Candidatus Methanoperedens nitratireducens TaxID=1392998 RepID=A0A062V736_9EURY|nr:flap endonuclease-1 [Candidatus Methanoperedens nitroreducens]KCZ71215.1 flap endonuclease 1 [Candidatus Methanoperedens nitroreducens]MDJ1421403.1 flap endonuclease-1 [Candidatus Methanoperedens sp.]
MGIDFGDLFEKKEIDLSDLRGKVIAIDAYNILYQFLSIIRQRDGTPLIDSHGEITSHLSGFLYRTTNLIEAGIRPVFVFDGEPPEFKNSTLNERKKIRVEAMVRWEEAKEKGDEAAFKYAQASSQIKGNMIEDAKKLLVLMGLPVIQAPSEGEAQAAFMVRNNDAYAAGSQDYDALLFGAPVIVRNLAVTGKRKLPGMGVYVDIKPQIIELESGLTGLGITREQLVDIALLIGTDYNAGIKGIGPKKALKLIKKHGYIEQALDELGEDIKNLAELKELFLNPAVTSDYELKWKKPDASGIIEFLCIQHDFSEARVSKATERLIEASKDGQQTLDRWF